MRAEGATQRISKTTMIRRFSNTNSSGGISYITDWHKAVFLAMTSGEPKFCLTSIHVKGDRAVAIVLVGHGGPAP
ncbi:hypothetical protein [Beijerinckia sp. L45]|uniref:hypothetical protein n=1 Tax=Beijerinckia sp. L45 TaxID=1641855 RepID=UPI00131E3D60|nr:hypothetical protein [Beijerinckia sp. L45]